MNRQVDLARQMRLFRIVNQSLIVSLLGAILMAVFFYVLTASSPLLGNIVWTDAARFGAIWWLTGFGGQINIAQGTLSLMPLLFTLLIVIGIYFPLKKEQIQTWHDFATVTFSGVILVAFVGLFAKASGAWWTSIIGVMMMNAVIALIAGRDKLFEKYDFPAIVMPIRKIVNWALVTYASAAASVFIIFLIFGFSKTLQIQNMYNQGILGNLGIIFLQLLYLPVFVVWAGAWLVGSSVFLGAGSTASIFGSQIGLLPAIPIFGVFPAPNFGAIWMWIIPAFFFFTAGVVLIRFPLKSLTNLKIFAIGGSIALLLTVFLIEIVSTLAKGGIGPGRMAVFGPVPTQLVLYLLLLFAVPLYSGMISAHKSTTAAIGKLLRKFKRKFKQGTANESSRKSFSQKDDAVKVARLANATNEENMAKTVGSAPEIAEDTESFDAPDVAEIKGNSDTAVENTAVAEKEDFADAENSSPKTASENSAKSAEDF